MIQKNQEKDHGRDADQSTQSEAVETADDVQRNVCKLYGQLGTTNIGRRRTQVEGWGAHRVQTWVSVREARERGFDDLQVEMEVIIACRFIDEIVRHIEVSAFCIILEYLEEVLLLWS